MVVHHGVVRILKCYSCNSDVNICREDHLAIDLALKHKVKLQLYIPCEWDYDLCKYKESGSKESISTAKKANMLHDYFSVSVNKNSLKEINTVLSTGAYEVGKGFKDRNTKIAESVNHLIAFTWGDGDEPGSRGTMDTWRKCKSTSKIHIPLSSLRYCEEKTVTKEKFQLPEIDDETFLKLQLPEIDDEIFLKLQLPEVDDETFLDIDIEEVVRKKRKRS